MRELEILATVSGRSASAIYPLLCDFERYPEHSDAVRSVSVMDAGDGYTVSRWEVNFQRGVLRWTEQDLFNPDTHTITFHQIEGDVDHFAGEWALHDSGEGCLIRFTATFDLGLPSLSELLDPIADEALRSNIRSILLGLLGDSVVIMPAPSAA